MSESVFKPFVVLKLNNVYPAAGEVGKGFFALFTFALVLEKEIKSHDFKISVESYECLEDINCIINGMKFESKNEIIQTIQKDVNDNFTEFPIELQRAGNDYNWYILSKMIEICENV